MKAMLLNEVSNLDKIRTPLTLSSLPIPQPKDNEILIKVLSCGVCHTELDEIEGRTPPPIYPIILGHQVVGRVQSTGVNVTLHNIGDRVGIGWVFSACGKCKFCLDGNENLCPEFMATGRDRNGGYAEYMTIPAAFAIPIPDLFSHTEAAPLLCAGAIGYRSLRLASLKTGQLLGLTGFGASGHLVLKMVKHLIPDMDVFVFARSGPEREFAKELGAAWTGDIGDSPPLKMDAIIDTTPAWKPVVESLKSLVPGGRLVINAIRKENTDKSYLAKIDYEEHLWMEKEIKSVANVSRQDISEFLNLAADIPIRPEIQEFTLEEANQALLELKDRKINGGKVLCIA